MKAARRALGLVVLALVPLSCAVYKDDILPSDQDDEVGGSAGSTGADSAGVGGSSASSAGTPGAGGKVNGGAGGTSNVGGGAGSSGNSMMEAGGAPDGDGGEGAGGDDAGGTAGSAGHGGGGRGGGGQGGGGSGGGGGKGGMGGTAGSGGSNGGAGQGGGGNGGTGGKPSGPLCSDHPLTARAGWVATASDSGVSPKDIAANLVDNKVTRWSTSKPQEGDEWIQIDFGASVSLSHVNLQQAEANANDYPRSYAVIVSSTANNLGGAAKASGVGINGVSTPIALTSMATGRYLLIKQLGTSLSWWSAVEVEVSCVDPN